jgi:hypothetical protein
VSLPDELDTALAPYTAQRMATNGPDGTITDVNA